MADDPEPPPEGWHVPQRLPALVAVLTPLVLGAILLLAGWIYERRLRPGHISPVHSFPAPGIETYIHGGARDPKVRAVPPPADPAVARAEAEIVAGGLPGWAAR